jgi:hypothetical protein
MNHLVLCKRAKTERGKLKHKEDGCKWINDREVSLDRERNACDIAEKTNEAELARGAAPTGKKKYPIFGP